jgi:hypothetical protein
MRRCGRLARILIAAGDRWACEQGPVPASTAEMIAGGDRIREDAAAIAGGDRIRG